MQLKIITPGSRPPSSFVILVVLLHNLRDGGNFSIEEALCIGTPMKAEEAH